MEKLLHEVIEPLLDSIKDETQKSSLLASVEADLKAFCKGELIPINKQLGKKTRQLFVASSQIENLKENVSSLSSSMNSCNNQINKKTQQILKQKIKFEQEIFELTAQNDDAKKQLKQFIIKSTNEIEKLIEVQKDKMLEMKKEHKHQLDKELNQERLLADEKLHAEREAFQAQKNHLIEEANKDRGKLIKKYEEKLFQLTNSSEQLLKKTQEELNQRIEELRDIKKSLESQLLTETSTTKRLTSQLTKQHSLHENYKNHYESISQKLTAFEISTHETQMKLQEENAQLKDKLRRSEKEGYYRIKELETNLERVILQKDQLFEETVSMLKIDSQTAIDSQKNNMMEEQEIAINAVQVRAYEEMFQQIKMYEALDASFKELKFKYQSIQQHYEAKISEMEKYHDLEIINLNQRKGYEQTLSGQNAKREYSNLLNKFNLQIQSLKNNQVIQQELLLKKGQEEKVALTNKLTTQYEAMLTDLRGNNQIQIKQKIIEFERKSKGFEKRLGESEKRRSQLKGTVERMKYESQMKIESMMQINQKQEVEIDSLQERILEYEKSKSILINDYEFKILTLMNSMERQKDDFELREEELRSNLNDRITLKNKQFAKLAEKIKLENQELIKKHKDRVNLLEKQYEELKRVINQKTSLPEDIEALKTFHAAYMLKQNQLKSEKKKRQELQRELHSKDAIEKVFVSKEAFQRVTNFTKFTSSHSNHFLANKFASHQF